MWLYLVQGFGLGLAAAAQPGPLQTFLITQAVTRGWRRSWINALAPLVSDGFIVTVVLAVLSQLPAWVQRFLYLAGGIFVLYLASEAYQAWRNFRPELPEVNVSATQSLFKAALTNILNPSPYIFWSLVNGPILLRGWRESPSHGLGFLLGFYGTFVISLVGIIILFGTAGKLGTRVSRALLGISVIALGCFGVYQLWLGLFNGS